MRLVDLIRRGKLYVPPGFLATGSPHQWIMPYTKKMLAHAQIFEISNVAEYFYAGTPQETWDERTDFPNVAPPFPVFWMEWKKPSKIMSEVHGTRASDGHADLTGLLFRVVRLGDDGEGAVGPLLRHWFLHETPITHPAQLEGTIKHLTMDRTAEPHWMMHASVYFQDRRTFPDGTPSGSVYEYLNTIDTHGHLTGGPALLMPMPEEIAMQSHLFTGIAFPAFLALSLLHCKNVQVETHEAPPKLARKIERRYGVPPVIYKTLIIEPMTRQIRSVSKQGNTGSQLRLHVVQGRFRTYTEERPLFGKHAGTWWWDDYVRGSASAGIVQKDYEVRLP